MARTAWSIGHLGHVGPRTRHRDAPFAGSCTYAGNIVGVPTTSLMRSASLPRRCSASSALRAWVVSTAVTGPLRHRSAVINAIGPASSSTSTSRNSPGAPPGGGWRTRGRGYDNEGSITRRVGYRYLHTALDDRTRLVYSEILDDEQAVTAAAFWKRAATWFVSKGTTCERVITDNGSCYRSGLWHRACAETGTTVKKTRPRRPQTNGKVERYHRILLEEWAYIRPWTSEAQRHTGYNRFVHFYNHHRSHGALGWATPASIIKDNLPAEHS